MYGGTAPALARAFAETSVGGARPGSAGGEQRGLSATVRPSLGPASPPAASTCRAARRRGLAIDTA